jgi:hypothetical protein
MKGKKSRLQDVVAIGHWELNLTILLPASSKSKNTVTKPIQMLALMLIIQIGCLPGGGTFLWSFKQVGSSLLNH